MKPDFEKAQNAATELLLGQNIDSLYIDARNFKLPSNIIIDSIQNFSQLTHYPLSLLNTDKIDGALVLSQGNKKIILYDDDISNEQRKHWGIIHELGHIHLGHTDDCKNSEIEVHFFAAQLVSPEIVLWDICRRKGQLTDTDIFTHFNLSYEASTKRIQTLSHRLRYNSAASDKELLNKFVPILDRVFSGGQKVS